MKAIFRAFMALMVWLYQRTNGKIGGQMQGLSILLLTTTGRKTGKPRVTPLAYFEQAGAYVICASNAGFDTHPGWFHNLKSQPQVTLQIKGQHLTATAEVADPALRQQLWDTLVQQAPGYQNYVKRTAREIPMVRLRPVAPA